MRQFLSSLEIGEEVTFKPMYRHQQKFGITEEEIDGTVMAVRFTEAKVFYDIYSPYWGRLFKEVDSAEVKKISPLRSTSSDEPFDKKFKDFVHGLE